LISLGVGASVSRSGWAGGLQPDSDKTAVASETMPVRRTQ